jgi:putative acetyltransferase
MVSIRKEEPKDTEAIRLVNELAFAQSTEAGIVDKLRKDCDDLLSLVAVQGDEIVGHILFSPSVIESIHGPVVGVGLAPMAVLPQHQRRGIGTALVEDGISRLRESGCPFVIVLGHVEYYRRFGFESASRYHLRCQWEGVPDDAFMIMVFDEKALQGADGVARYRDEFDEAMQ